LRGTNRTLSRGSDNELASPPDLSSKNKENSDLLNFAKERNEEKMATQGIDASLVETEKIEALYSYN